MTASSPDEIAPLRIRWPHDFDREDEWAVGGVPFHRGELDPEEDVAVVTSDGERRPVQTRVLAYWPDGSVKWMLVVVACDVTGGDGASLTLVRHEGAGEPTERSSSLSSGRPSAQVTVERTDTAITVDTGPMTVSVPVDTAALFDSVIVDGTERLRPDDPPELFVSTRERDGDETVRYSDRDGRAYRSVEVEEAGPNRAVVAVTGTHVADDGTTFAPYTVRLYLFAGERDVRVTHTFVYDGDPETDLLRSVGLRVPTAVDGVPTFGYGGKVGPATRTAADRREDWGMTWRYGELYQSTATSYRFDKQVDTDRPSVAVERGERADGWVDLADERRGLCVAVREAWQNAPTALRMDAEEGVVTAGLYPEQADPLDLGWYSETAYGRIYESPGTAVDRNSPRVPTMNAHGLAKTHELLFAFHDGARDETSDDPGRHAGDSERNADAGRATTGDNLSKRVRAFEKRALVTVPPERYADTGVLGPYAATAPPEFDEQESWFEENLDYVLQEQSYRGWYGMLDYGDVVRAYDVDTHQWRSDRGGHGWLNTEFQPDQWLWFCFLRTGRYDAFRFAEAMTRHTSDVDVHHAGPWWGFGARHGVQHWSDGDREIRVSMPGARRLHYYLTGDERTRDVIETAVSRYRTMQREPGRTWMGFREEMYTRSDVAAALYAYYVAWEMTGERTYESLVRTLLTDVFCETHPSGAPYNRARVDLSTGEGEPVTDSPVISSNMFLQFGAVQLLVELAALPEVPEATELVVAYANYHLRSVEERRAAGDNAEGGLPHRVRTMPLHAVAYRETGEEAHRAALEAGLAEREVELGPAPWDDDLLAITNDWPPMRSPISGLAAFGRKAPYAFAVFARDEDGGDGSEDGAD